jgi:hypothetical protein
MLASGWAHAEPAPDARCDSTPPALPSGRSDVPPPPPGYTPLYESRFDRDLFDPRIGKPFDVFSKRFLSFGADVTYARTGQPLHFGANYGLVGGEVSFVPFVSRTLVWGGAFAEYTYDSLAKIGRVAPGVEVGYAFLAFDVAPLLNLDGSRVGVQARALIALPVYHTEVDYAASCCPPNRAGARSCACDGPLHLFEVEPYVRVEHEPSGFGTDSNVTEWFLGLLVKWGYGF